MRACVYVCVSAYVRTLTSPTQADTKSSREALAKTRLAMVLALDRLYRSLQYSSADGKSVVLPSDTAGVTGDGDVEDSGSGWDADVMLIFDGDAAKSPESYSEFVVAAAITEILASRLDRTVCGVGLLRHNDWCCDWIGQYVAFCC